MCVHLVFVMETAKPRAIQITESITLKLNKFVGIDKSTTRYLSLARSRTSIVCPRCTYGCHPDRFEGRVGTKAGALVAARAMCCVCVQYFANCLSRRTTPNHQLDGSETTANRRCTRIQFVPKYHEASQIATRATPSFVDIANCYCFDVVKIWRRGGGTSTRCPGDQAPDLRGSRPPGSGPTAAAGGPEWVSVSRDHSEAQAWPRPISVASSITSSQMKTLLWVAGLERKCPEREVSWCLGVAACPNTRKCQGLGRPP
mmetsp:Transcript_7292/g.16686  ORF Transcript_7292/g.16686 Transcript_7292/m.16686 type:complete len:258 (-) Transcript_7292:1155-1928(-)